MTLHELIKKLSEIITPETDAFNNYVLYTSDDNLGFLRTRHYWEDVPLRDRKFKRELSRAFVTAEAPIKEDDLVKRDKFVTSAKLQVTYYNTDIEDMEWDADLGYNYLYIFDLENKSFEMKYIRSNEDCCSVYYECREKVKNGADEFAADMIVFLSDHYRVPLEKIIDAFDRLGYWDFLNSDEFYKMSVICDDTDNCKISDHDGRPRYRKILYSDDEYFAAERRIIRSEILPAFEKDGFPPLP